MTYDDRDPSDRNDEHEASLKPATGTTVVRINGASDDLAELQVIKDGKEISSEEFTVLNHEPAVLEVVNDANRDAVLVVLNFLPATVWSAGLAQTEAGVDLPDWEISFPECDVEYATAIAITIPGESDVSVRLVSAAD